MINFFALNETIFSSPYSFEEHALESHPLAHTFFNQTIKEENLGYSFEEQGRK